MDLNFELIASTITACSVDGCLPALRAWFASSGDNTGVLSDTALEEFLKIRVQYDLKGLVFDYEAFVRVYEKMGK